MSQLFGKQIHQPLNLSGSFTGSFLGSINNAISASYALTASYVTNLPVIDNSRIISGSNYVQVYPNGNIFTSGSNYISNDVIISGSLIFEPVNGDPKNLIIISSSVGDNANYTLQQDDQNFLILSRQDGNRITKLGFEGPSLYLEANGPSSSIIEVNSENPYILVRGSATNYQGIKYYAQYSSSYVSRSLVDKEYVDTQIRNKTFNTGSFVTTSSFNSFTASINSFTASYNTGSFSGSFTGSFKGTASWANNTISASYANSANYANSADYANNAGIADTLSNHATIDQINVGNTADVFVRPGELEQSKYATLNIYNYNNFT